ncbi:MAG: type VI secretion system-associated FHA domain protein TagH [Rubrivivax sp.]
MITLSVHSLNGLPAADAPSATFDELGGTIGRAEGNQLVLNDPERTVSRVHARVVFRAGGFVVVDNGSNPIAVNGRQLGAGAECPLQPGDRIEIGGYVLVAGAAAPAASSDPFADLFGAAALGLATGAGPTTAASAPIIRTAAPGPAAPIAAAPPASRPLPMAQTPSPSPALARPAAGPAVIPDDWDPFAPEPSAAAPAAPAAAPAITLDAPLFDEPRPGGAVALGGDDSLDDLFGLAALPRGGDPLGAAAAANRPNTAAAVDPLQALAQAPTAAPASVADHASDLYTPMPLPPAAPDRAAEPPLPPVPQPRGAIFSWEDPPREGRVVTLPGVHRGRAEPQADIELDGEPPEAPRTQVLPTVARTLSAPRPAAPSAPSAPSALPSAGAAAGEASLRAALLEGLQAPGLRLDELTPERMRLIGAMLRESARGAVELLAARAALKRELRARMTMITARQNNPLKFSPDADVALQHLLGERTPGFMGPAAAMRDAFDDLRAHELGVMAGMRAALAGVLARFEPAQLEAKLGERSRLAQLIPAARKARLWELFQELFAQLQAEAQDDFDELFGQAFLEAYEDQLARLDGEGGR